MFTKSLDELITDALEKEQKIESQIENLSKEKGNLQSLIKTKTNELVECELEENQEGLTKYQKEIGRLKTQLNNVSNRIDAYKAILKKGCLNEKESDKIRKAIAKEREENGRRIRALDTEKEDTQKKISALKKRVEEINREVNVLRNQNDHTETKIQKILGCIDPRAKRIQYYDRQRFIKNWIGGVPTESIFEPKQEPKGPTIIDRSTHTEEPEDNPNKEISVEYTDENGRKKIKKMTRKEHQEEKRRKAIIRDRTIDSFTEKDPQVFLKEWKQSNPDKKVIDFNSEEYQNQGDKRYHFVLQWEPVEEKKEVN